MAYPDTLDQLTNPTANDRLNSPSHSGQHTDANNAIEAIEAKLGINTSLEPTTIDYRVRALENSQDINLFFNVSTYGAQGDGVTDDTAEIQQAINDAHDIGGGIVFMPPGTYLISSALTIYTGITLRGSGTEATFINQSNATAKGIIANDAASVTLEDFLLDGPNSGTGIGIEFTWTLAGNNPFHNFRNIWVRQFGGDGVKVQTPIVSRFDKVIVQDCGGHGFNWYHAGTSCTFTACWARDNALAGYRFFESVYQGLTGCASDNNGVNYWIQDAQSIGFFACGSEGALQNDATYNGYGWKIDNSSVITLDSCWVTDNREIAVWVTGGSQAISLNVADNTPNASALNFITIDSGCNATIYDLHNTTANNIAAGTTTIINDGAGGTTIPGTLTAAIARVANTNGTLSLTATTDGGEYNLSANTTGTMAIFGSGGQTLHINMLDGNLTLTAGTLTLTAGGAVINGGITTATANTIYPFMPAVAAQALSGPGAINITTYLTKWTTTGADAGTLANGARIGQLKKVQMIVDGGDGTLTPDNLANGTTITFADAGDFALMIWNGTDWVAIELGNDADGVTAPVLA